MGTQQKITNFFMGNTSNDTSANHEQDEESFTYAMQIVLSMILPMSMQAAIELQVFEIIAKAGPDAKLSAQEIVAQLPSKNPEASSLLLDRLLRVLASHSIVGCSLADDEQGGNSERVYYSLTPVSKYFVQNEDGGSLGPLMNLFQDKVFLASWSQVKDAILEGGIPFDRVHGTNAFEYYCGRDPRFNQLFNTGMINHTTLVMKKILETYKGFEKLNRVVDVGGGLGMTLSIITSKYPSIQGINFDLPHVIQHAPAYPGQQTLTTGVAHVGGDMFESVPNGDAIFLKLLKNCYKAIPDDGKVIVLDAVLPVIPEPNSYVRATSMMDFLMLTQIPGRKERTKQEFEALATQAGFSGIRYECFVCNLCLMEFFK
ncbi:O-methyltransferase, family 2 [Corchorus olitorius]|uniref:O-methyltransferase, family 2 n=1 Tax=Corchorus olitorius TaxID=93759 RepID=A0A1R3I0X5_9ROSI|nr:O-methyltransferase, family 2 [Corchorus olitorius]